jgi:hypothetical protein
MHWKKPIVALACLGVAAAAAALPALSRATIRGPITLRATETLKRPQPGAHAPTDAGHFTISGAIVHKGTVTDRRTQKGNVATVRRVAVGRNRGQSRPEQAPKGTPREGRRDVGRVVRGSSQVPGEGRSRSSSLPRGEVDVMKGTVSP